MKEKVFILGMAITLILGAVIAACIQKPNVKKERTTYQIDNEFKIEVVTIDGCEYLYGPWGSATVLTHKGNCPNSYHYK